MTSLFNPSTIKQNDSIREEMMLKFFRDPNLEELPSEGSQIVDFLTGKYVLVTGTTGFFGKVLVEKILRMANNVGGIYVLARPKKGNDIETRLDDIYNDALYARLLRKFPKFRSKIIPVEGDMVSDKLGIDEHQRNEIIDKVSIIFHVAATVRFDEKLRVATQINVKGTMDMLNLAKQCKNLESFVYVSTAYSNCLNKHIEERFYDSPIHHDKLLNMVQLLTDEELEVLTPNLLGQWPNTYSFTKAVCENLVKEMGKDLPVCVFRPSVVLSTFEEPVTGWIDNLYGPVGSSLGVTLGILRVALIDMKKYANIVPVDYVINGMIAAAYKLATTRATDPIPVYNYVLSKQNVITWDTYAFLGLKYGMLVPSPTIVWNPMVITTPNHRLFHILSYFLHMIPAQLADVYRKSIGKREKFLKIAQKIDKFSVLISYFNSREWSFDNENVEQLWKSINDTDRALFPFDTRTIDWNEYFKTFGLGLKVYILKEKVDNVPMAMNKLRKLYVLHQLLKLVLVLILLYVLCKLYSLIFN